MLKKSLFSPARPQRAETRLIPYGVLASLRGSTLGRAGLKIGVAEVFYPFAKAHCKGERPTPKCGMYLLGPSLAAALPAERRVLARRGWAGENRGLFEHPGGCVLLVCHPCGLPKFSPAKIVYSLSPTTTQIVVGSFIMNNSAVIADA